MGHTDKKVLNCLCHNRYLNEIVLKIEKLKSKFQEQFYSKPTPCDTKTETF